VALRDGTPIAKGRQPCEEGGREIAAAASIMRRSDGLTSRKSTVIDGESQVFGGLLERLEQLERSNETLSRSLRRLRSGFVGGAAGMAVLVLAGAAAVAPSLEARSFVLRDEAGKMRAALAIRPDGSPGLGFLDESGRVRLSMDLGPAGPQVNLMNGIGQPQAALAIRPDGLPGLAIFDRSGQPRLSLDVTEAGTPAVHLNGKQGELRAALAIRDDGTPGLGLFAADGQLRGSFEIPDKADVAAAGVDAH
jgi:hypothetical protein